MSELSGFINARAYGAKGSSFTASVHAEAGSNVITVDNIGDFAVGDEVVVTKCCLHYPAAVLFERRDVSKVNPRKWIHNQPIGERIMLDGYDGSQGSPLIFYLDFDPDTPDVVRYTKDFARSFHTVFICKDGWTELFDGIRVKIGEFKERGYGCTAAFVCDDKLVALIEKIEGNRIFLSKEANHTADGELLHSDSHAIQCAIDAAISQNTGVFLPNGTYRLANSLVISHAASFTFEGESSTGTMLDNAYGHIGIEREGGSCFVVRYNKEVILKNLSMTGNLGFDDRDMAGALPMRGGDSVWGFYLMKTNATCLSNNESVYIENCHAKRMSAECFYASSSDRERHPVPDDYRSSITYMRCSVEDCARNAFNNNDTAENTSLLYCRVINVGGCSWEGASRFVKIHGCYFRNCGSIAVGNVRSRSDKFNFLGTGQHIITDNYFENGVCYGDAMMKIGSTASQIIVKGNNFINFNANGIWFMGECGPVDTPCENLIVSGNIFDLTASVSESRPRYGIKITSQFATISDNQIYVRGERDENVTGITISDDAARIVIHDNTIANAGTGICSEYAVGEVGTVSGEDRFFARSPRAGREGLKPMLLRRLSDLYRGWHLVWEDGTESEIGQFDWQTTEFSLTEPRALTEGDRFMIYHPTALPWSIHHNIVDNCESALQLDSFSGKRAQTDGNLTN